MRITSAKVWASVDVRMVREMVYSIGAQAEAVFDDAPFDDATPQADIDAAIDNLFQTTVMPSIMRQMKFLAKGDPLFRHAMTVERPKVIRQYQLFAERMAGEKL